MFWKSNENIEKRILEYFDLCDRCIQDFEKAWGLFLEVGPNTSFEAAVQKTHERESAADDLRRDIELTLYGKALLPESRGDLLGLLENYDRLLTAAETFLFSLLYQQVRLGPELSPRFRQLVDTNLSAYYLVRKAVESLLTNPRATLHAAKQVDSKESESDRIERQMIRAIFSSAMDKADKLELRDLVLLIGRISDLAEHTSDRVGIISIKRQA